MKTISLALFLTTFSLFGQNDIKTCEILSKINALIQREHINPKPVDDSLSVFVFDSFIDELDPLRNIFLKSEFDILSQKYRLNIDNLIKDKDCAFLTDIASVYKKDLLRNMDLLEKIDKGTVDYELKDTIRFYKKAFPIYLLDNQVEKVWRKKIKYEILDDIAQTSKNLDSIKANFNALAMHSKNTIIQNELCRINSILQNESGLQESLYNHFCSYFDPHTSYFSDDSKLSFVASLSKEHLSLGLNVSLNKKSEIIVDELDPNGPAFLTGKIKKGDQIISISNLKETLLVSCASLEAISNMILSEANKNIVLTLKRNSGKNFEVLVEKQVIKDEENTVYSFIVEKDIKIGYIKIPSFYADFEGNNGKGCAQDVAKEIIKLQKDNIKGLVIDLVDNGGGSMEEAIKLAGMFIDDGPISVVIDNKKVQTTIDDPYKGMLYKDPIVLLINGNSASASEFFASVLQDYHRALLIGSITLGKATMQTIVPLEENDNKNFVKVTVNKFYRITGKSHQSLGVFPNVVLPEIYETIFPKENNFPTAFKNDSINTFIRFRPYAKNNLIQKVLENSRLRIVNDDYFNDIKTINKRIDDLVNQPKKAIPLTIDTVFEEQNKVSDLWEEINSFDSGSIDLNVYNSDLNRFLLAIHPSEKVNNQFQLDALKTNHYLNEAITIIEDFNALK
ncbi:S41 family peptidase [Flavobacterium gawalongense]|uniref:Peptidase S41 n=1 Tax=Flavobacterium gawalongense TaxID=2594432 RepID=A0A553BS16_9FLAO|nr:S41 family peptidase [Flavobacterium gawalongense]TRX03137.1 peptidase S41 [Flavobacterium gawalongense]TRX09799.1 peptidase S41 [Flavobacterium gawalongense]TRX11025.1 peptidase S41 [Flavobacterium gawalongense]TRX12012.1 peptidase S41 [Flavobacterium gawalongense]TRX29858.1 peptidase S41 [Flavobacterium gawalongense]